MKALDRKLVRDLWRLRGQVATVALVVASGVASLVSLRSAWESLERSRAAYYEEQRFGDLFASLEHAPQAVAGRLEELPGVARVVARAVVDARLPMPGLAMPPIGLVVGLPRAGASALDEVHLDAGRLPQTGGRDEALVLTKFAQRHGLKPGDVLPVVVRGVRREVRLVGTASSPEFIYPVPATGGLELQEERFAVLWMEARTVESWGDLDGAFNDVVLSRQPGASDDAVREAVDRVLEPYGGRGAVTRARQPSNEILTDEINQLATFARVVPAIFLGVAAFLLNVVLSRLVLLQRGEIAILKAFGYSDAAVGLHYLAFVMVAALAGGGLGLGVGARLGRGMTGLYAEAFSFPGLSYRLDAGVVATAVAVSVGAAALGALLSVRQVVRLAPAQAMQPPAPATYRPTVLERAGLDRLVGTVARMVLRELERRPLRALMSALGFAMAVAILLVGRFSIDAVRRLVELQYDHAAREDVAVSLTRAVASGALHELEHLPGVLVAESLRGAPVRLRAGARHYDTVLVATSADRALRRVVDLDGVPVPEPADGVRLTDRLALHLGVGAGDEVDVELQEGRRRHARLRVTALADEPVGLQAYVSEELLARLLGETPTMTGAVLQVDAAALPLLLEALDERPLVASVSVRGSERARFRDRLDRTIGITTFVLTLFAATIAVGIVYNNARITLAARARELATLRVLGFTRAEVFRLLLGELALQVVVAIPVGLALGRWMAAGVIESAHQDRMRLPLEVSSATDAFAVVVSVAAAAASALVVRRHIDRLDLVAVLKARE